MEELSDITAERGVLAGIFKYGGDAYLDVIDILSVNTFTLDSNKIIWDCLHNYLKDNIESKIDYPTIISSANSLGLSSVLEKPTEQQHLRGIINMPIELKNVRKLAGKIRKLEISRLLKEQLKQADKNLSRVTGEESIDSILGLAEAPIFDLTSLLTSENKTGAQLMGNNATKYLQHLIDNPREMIGISTGLPIFDFAIGGGLRTNTLDIIAARPKTGKAQPVSSVVQTPNGPVKIGDLKVGDLVCVPGKDKYCKIKSIHPQGIKQIYDIHFYSAGFDKKVSCCIDHLWEICDSKGNNKKIVSLDDIIKGQLDFYVPSYEVNFEYRPIKASGFLVGRGFVYSQRESYYDIIYNTIEYRKDFIHGLITGENISIIYHMHDENLLFYTDIEIPQWKIDILENIFNSCGYYFYQYFNPINGVQKQFFKASKGAPNSPSCVVKTGRLEECVCLKLDNDEGIYFTDYFIPTHNTMLSDNIGIHISEKVGVPVFNIDTEMTTDEHLNRVIAMIAGVNINDIETGKIGKKPTEKKKAFEAAEKLSNIPYYYESVIGLSFEEILSSMRRWVTKTVGLNNSGKANPCVIIYDYLKMLSGSMLNNNMAEYQALGFITTGLKNFMGRYGVSCLCFAQLNRDGIDKEDTDVISGSDRIVHYCTSLTLYKRKSDEERAEGGPNNFKYTHKLVPLIQRSGKGLDFGDYINIEANYDKATIKEGPRKKEIENSLTNSSEIEKTVDF